MTEKTASWIKALWPPAVALVAIVSLLSGLSSRLDAAETEVDDHETRIRVLEEACARGMATQEAILSELQWMRDHWPILPQDGTGSE